MEETKCYCGHTTYCDCGPEIDGFKHEVKVIPKEEILANRSNAYEFIDFDKQETLEEGITKYLKTLKGDEYKSMYDFCNQQTLAFINGAKWQQEKSYSEKEVLQILASYADWSINDIRGWFEQFKKK
jgi:hypothetical protein